MKKILLILLCLWTVAVAFGAVCGAREVQQGETIELTIQVDQYENILAGAIEFVYDDAVLEIVSGEWLIDAMIKDYSLTDGRGVFAYATPVTVGGDVFRVTARVVSAERGAHTELVARVRVIDQTNVPVVIEVSLGEYTIPCSHDFSAQNATDEYLNTAADCTSPATYFYSCSHCAAKGTKTFEYGEPAPHTYDREVAKKKYLKEAATEESPALYYKSCSCGEAGSETFESGEPVTALAQKESKAVLLCVLGALALVAMAAVIALSMRRKDVRY